MEDATFFRVQCSENEGLVAHLLVKKQEMVDRHAMSENLSVTLINAQRGIASCKVPIKTLEDLSRIKGVGKWILRLMKGFFAEEEASAAPAPNPAQKGKNPKERTRYVPRKNSAAYALLIVLHRAATTSGRGFLRKQELIDAAEASGLSGTSIMAEKRVLKPGQFGTAPKNWYSGWSCMQKLISKGLVVKSSCPAKYMITDEGQEVARECLARSGMDDHVEQVTGADRSQEASMSSTSHEHHTPHPRFQTGNLQSAASCQSMHPISIPDPPLSQSTAENFQFVISDSEPEEILDNCNATITTSSGAGSFTTLHSSEVSMGSDFFLQTCTSFVRPMNFLPEVDNANIGINKLAMPPRRDDERFEDVYDVTLVLDDRENFGPRSRKIHDILSSQFKISVEIRRLPIGDGIWIARHRHHNIEYVLDFIVERKRVDDLQHSIRDNRYRDQKLRLQRCGIQKLIYLVEGDPNGCEAAESIKSACFTTEILDGFDVQKTAGLMETIKKYGFLTKAICEVYREEFQNVKTGQGSACTLYDDFVKKCQDLEKLTISNVFSLQLMQVPQVTEEVALTVVKLYPTLISLARAYALLEGDISAQEEMLKRKSNVISGSASRNIFKLVWGS